MEDVYYYLLTANCCATAYRQSMTWKILPRRKEYINLYCIIYRFKCLNGMNNTLNQSKENGDMQYYAPNWYMASGVPREDELFRQSMWPTSPSPTKLVTFRLIKILCLKWWILHCSPYFNFWHVFINLSAEWQPPAIFLKDLGWKKHPNPSSFFLNYLLLFRQ